MTPREKIDAAVDYLLDRGVSRHNAAPIHYQLAWLLGITVPPPLFQSFPGLLVFNALAFGLIFGVLAFVFERHHDPLGVTLVLMPTLSCAVGLVAAVVCRLVAWRLKLPRWADFLADRSDAEADW